MTNRKNPPGFRRGPVMPMAGPRDQRESPYPHGAPNMMEQTGPAPDHAGRHFPFPEGAPSDGDDSNAAELRRRGVPRNIPRGNGSGGY